MFQRNLNWQFFLIWLSVLSIKFGGFEKKQRDPPNLVSAQV